MTDAERNALVERMTDAAADAYMDNEWITFTAAMRAAIRAALAVAEPVVREAVASDLERMGRGHVAHEHALILRMVERIRARGAA